MSTPKSVVAGVSAVQVASNRAKGLVRAKVKRAAVPASPNTSHQRRRTTSHTPTASGTKSKMALNLEPMASPTTPPATMSHIFRRVNTAATKAAKLPITKNVV